MIIKLHDILITNTFMKPRLGGVNIDKPSTYTIKINLYLYAITLSTNSTIYFIENVCSKVLVTWHSISRKKIYK
jgi:hypothetical protein